MIGRAIGVAARQRPDLNFEWHHFGDGDQLDSVTVTVAELPVNASASLHGYCPIETILEFYKTHPVDAFVNASLSEGGAPVAIMEAMSCGIPVVATSVGGNLDIASDRTGRLVSQDVTPEEIADAVIAISSPDAAGLRANARQIWAENFDAARNCREMARQLHQLGRKVEGTSN